MKLTPWKIARVLQHLPLEDQVSIKLELREQNDIIEEFDEATGETVKRRKGISPETISRLVLMHNAIAPAVKTKGAFGKRGTNRKAQLFQKRLVMSELFEKAKKEIEDEQAEATTEGDTDSQ
jgi:hypothetical protein